MYDRPLTLALSPQVGRGDYTPSPALRERAGVRAGKTIGTHHFDINNAI